MSFSRAIPTRTTPKGQLRCFQCRQTGPAKDGNWRDLKNQQVFLCKNCEKIVDQAPPPAAKPSKKS